VGCVVCQKPIETPQFANAWERSRKIYPCCSADCASRFDPDAHWIPATEPVLVVPAEERRLLATARTRLAVGDKPCVVVRELLVAGVSSTGIPFILAEANAGAAANEKAARRSGIMNALSTLLGRWRVSETTGPDAKELAVATADVDAWRAKFRA
jgi:hypothetical protein